MIVTSADPNGYILFCLCMGRFGNQVEHFLGGLAFAYAINRTLILPPWRTNRNVEFDEWFEVSAILRYHRAILAQDFMTTKLSETVWPKHKRYGFCYQVSGQETACKLKEGNPFKSFWDELNVDFVRTIGYSITYQTPRDWIDKFPASDFPVLALKGAPASFPMHIDNIQLQKYLKFSENIKIEAEALLERYFGDHSNDYLAIHLRNGPDWERACEFLPEIGSRKPFMSSYQCNLPLLMRQHCYPEKSDVLLQVKKEMEERKLKKLLVATDKYSYEGELRTVLGQDIKVVHADPWTPVLDIYLLSNAKHFIGNCVSSFSAFVWRHRTVHNLGPTSHFNDRN